MKRLLLIIMMLILTVIVIRFYLITEKNKIDFLKKPFKE